MFRLLGHEVEVSMTYISQSSDFALYLEDYMNQYDSTHDLKCRSP